MKPTQRLYAIHYHIRGESKRIGILRIPTYTMKQAEGYFESRYKPNFVIDKITAVNQK